MIPVRTLEAQPAQLGFNLAPWRRVLEKEIGRQVMGVMRRGDVPWQLRRAIG
jgi:uncharacterized protein DUF3363